jgi:DNA polymerase V
MAKEKKTNSTTSFEFYLPGRSKPVSLKFYSSQIPAGFPSPADDFAEKTLDLNDYLIGNKAATFLVKVQGNSMINTGIFDGDLLVIDRSKDVVNGKVILGVLNGEFTVKRLELKNNKVFLLPENDQFEKIKITEEMDFKIWGVVTFAIHKL